MNRLRRFKKAELVIVNEAVGIAEEITGNAYKLSPSEMAGYRYDVKTAADLNRDEIVRGPFAQIVRYVGRRAGSSLTSSEFDFYKVCLQDHNVLSALKRFPELTLRPFMVYIVTHELVHIIRFIKFLQAFDASPEEKMVEEIRVHEKTMALLKAAQMPGMGAVFDFYRAWQGPIDDLKEMMLFGQMGRE